jgi:type IV secretion system protein TrbJ
MIRRRLLAAVMAVAVLFEAAQPAYALFGVGDVVFDPTSFAEIAKEAQNGLEELKWMADLYGSAQQQLQQLVNFYNLFAHITDATQLAQVLNSQFLHSPMLADALQLEQAFSGRGLNTTLAAKIQAVVSRMQYYAPSNNDFSGFHLNQQTTATAGQLSSAEDAYTANSQRVTGLTQLMAGINTADVKRVQDINARAAVETAIAISQSNQLTAARIMQDAHRDTAQQQREQAYRFSVDQLTAQAHNAAAAADGGAVNLVTR